MDLPPAYDSLSMQDFSAHLPQDEVHIWWTALGADKLVQSLSHLLTPDERARAARFKVPLPARQFIMSRAFLRLALGRYLRAEPGSLQFEFSAHGKPSLAGSKDLQFNLSHAEDLAVLAVAKQWRVGVDVERVRGEVNAIQLADRFFSAQEAEWVRSKPDSGLASRFFTCWTGKEAYVKARGEGLSISLQSFSVMPEAGNSTLRLNVFGNPEESARWAMWQFQPEPGFQGALAVERQPRKLRLGRWHLEISP